MASNSLATFDFHLLSISSRLSKEINELDPGDMLSDALVQELDGLTDEEMEFVADRLDDKILRTPLTEACCNGLTRVVKYLCQRGSPDLSRLRLVDPFNQSSRKKAPLLWIAVVNNNRAMVDVLLDEGADINAVTCTGSTSLSSACWLGWKEMVVHLLHRGADVNKPNSTGATCLINAVGNVILCKILLRNGADLYARDHNKKTVLNYAVDENRIETVNFLLTNDICCYEIDPRDAYGLLISALLVSPGMHICLSFLHQYLSPAEEANVVEFWACTVNETCSTTAMWLYAAKLRRQYNVMKIVDPPRAVFQYRTECVTAKKIKSLRTSLQYHFQVLMILIRILGPSHKFVIYYLEKYLVRFTIERRHSALNRICFLLLQLKIDRYGFLSTIATETSQSLVEHFEVPLYDFYDIHFLNFEVLLETLQFILSHLQDSREDVLEFPEEEQRNFDWNITFLLFLIFLTNSVSQSAHQNEKFRRCIREEVLAHGEAARQIRTVGRGQTLLHLAVSKRTSANSGEEDRATIGATFFPSVTIAKLLLDCGAVVNLLDYEGCSPLFAAVSDPHFDMKVAELLLTRGAHLERIGRDGNLVMDVRNELPPESIKRLNLPRVLSLQCICALTLTTTGVTEDSIPQGLRKFVKYHRR